MAVRLLLFLALISVQAVSFEFQVNVKSSLRFDAKDAKNRPVTKVITLLKDMQKQLEKEADEDEEIYEKMACWCETNDKSKTTLTADIEEFTASSARLNTEIKNLEADEDEEVYEKVACWCETNDKSKTTSIGDAEDAITSLTADIEEFTASSARLNTEIKNLEAEI